MEHEENPPQPNQALNGVIDMRSDTVTFPTKEMMAAMATARVGDDVFGDDPTLIQLEEKAAKLLGKEAGLFVPTGTMGNLISVMTHCEARGAEFMLGSNSHVFLYEGGGSAQLAGVHARSIPNAPDGTIALEDLEKSIRGDDPHWPRTKLIILENTHNFAGGRVLPTAYVNKVGELAKKHGLKLHIDGARFWNAVAALGEDPADMCKAADSITFCLSKGLGAPVGSVLVGSRDFIHLARRMRKVLGGGLRQAGVLGAAGIIALDVMAPRLKFDHQNANLLASLLSEINGITVDATTVETNIVFFTVETSFPTSNVEICDKLKAQDMLLIAIGPVQVRACTHYMVTEKDIRSVADAIKALA